MPDSNGDVTQGELQRWLKRVESDMKAGFDELRKDLRGLDSDLRSEIRAAQYVSVERWKDGRDTDKLYEEETRRIALAAIDTARSAVVSADKANGNLKWMVGLVVIVVVATLGAFAWVGA